MLVLSKYMKSCRISLKLRRFWAVCMCEGIFKKTPTNTMTAMNVRNANILLQLEMDNINPPRSGANIEIIPFTTIKDAKT